MKEFIKEREEVAATMRRLYERGLTTASGGNVSIRAGDFFLVTPGGTDKGRLQAHQICLVDKDGNPIEDNGKMSMETGMHLAVYTKRPDVRAIVHAHPIVATSFAIARKDIETNLAGESRALLGTPVLAPYALMGTAELADTVSAACLQSNVVLMENHGVIALGTSLFEAYDRLEVLEACARMTLVTNLLGGGVALSDDQVREIDKLFES